MAQVSLINRFGRILGWNHVEVHLFGRKLEGITELEYNDEVEKELVYGAGRDPIGIGEGNYKATASITLTQEERVALLESLPPGMRMQDIPPFDIVVKYVYQGRAIKDVLRNCEFTKDGVSAKQGDKSLAYKYDLILTHIEKNV